MTTRDEILTAYAAADQAHRIACGALHSATLAYRRRQIGDAEYLAAREAEQVALAAFDAAAAAVEALPVVEADAEPVEVNLAFTF